MSSRPKRAGATAAAAPTSVPAVLEELRRLSSEATRAGLARYGIPSEAAVGVPVGTLRQLGKRLGRDQRLALELWQTGVYEARLLAIFIADPEQVTPALMDRWCRDFDSWALCDTACFHLFDRTPHVWSKVKAWARRQPEMEKRAAFALLASAALHDGRGADEPYLEGLTLIEAAAGDPRNFVKKAVSWALNGIGGRGPEPHAAALALARRLAESADATARWVGRDALRDLAKPAALRRVKKAAARKASVEQAAKRKAVRGTSVGRAASKKKAAKKAAARAASSRRRSRSRASAATAQRPR